MADGSKRFDLVGRLGEGGSGVVYDAFDRERGARVALKMLRHVNPENLARLKREFRTVQDVHHANLVRLGDLVFDNDEWCFTMELVEGHDFIEYVRPRGLRRRERPDTSPDAGALGLASTEPAGRPAPGPEFDEPRTRDALRQLAGALTALHGAGLVHRDVKPSNVRVARDGRAVLLDFGLVVRYSATDASTIQVAGTPAYMAPEQADSGNVGPEADWYGVGVLLFEALTGRVPFEGPPLQVMFRKQSEQAPSPRALVPGVPSDLDALCVALLQRNPDARPSGQQVLAVLGSGSRLSSGSMPALAAAASHSQTTPFVGRGAEFDRLAEAFRDSERGEPITVVVQGESGLGKTSLVRRFAERLTLEDRDVVVLFGRCYERESAPYKGLDGVVDALARYLGRLPGEEARALVPTKPMPLLRLFPVLRRVEAIAEVGRGPQPALDPFELRTRAFAALRELLTRLGDRRRVVLVIDDAQWVDSDTLALLGELMRPPDAPRLLLVVTVRGSGSLAVDGTKHGQTLAGAMQGDVRTIAIERLPESDAVALAARLLERVGVRDVKVAEWCARQAHGHPLFIDMMTQTAGGGAGEGKDVLGLDDALWTVIGQLDPASREVLEVTAIAVSPQAFELVGRAAGRTGEDLARSIAVLRASHLVQASGARGRDRIEPYHDRVRMAVLAHLEPPRRREIHRRLAVALETSGTDELESMVAHWRGAGDDEQVARYAVLAGDRAREGLAFDRAARFYMQALSASRPTDVARRGLLEKLGDSCANAGRGKRAADAFLAAAEGADAAGALELRRRAAEQLLRSGHFDDGLSLALGVVRQAGMRMPATPLMGVMLFLFLRLWMRLRGLGFREREATQVSPGELTRVDMWWSLSFGLAVTDTLRGASANAQHVLLALRIGEPQRVARSMAQEAGFIAMSGGPVSRREADMFERARAISQRGGDPRTIAWVAAVEGIAGYLHGRFASALAHLERAEEIFATQCVGAAWELDTMRLFAVNCLVQLGRVVDAEARASRHLRESSFRGDLYAAVNLRIGFANLRWLASDEPDVARREIADAMAEWSKRGVHLEHFYELLALTNADLYAGRSGEALARFDERWPALRKSLLPWRVQSIRVLCQSMRGRCALARLEEGGGNGALLAVAAGCARRIERERAPWTTPLARTLAAGVAFRRADAPRATDLLREAARGFDAAEMGLHAAAARRVAGELVAGDEGREMVRAAEAWMTAQRIKSPERMTRMLAPGFRPSG
jgi:serine/threonine protein kinase/tetratricopeptide (TPR) repeat protein